MRNPPSPTNAAMNSRHGGFEYNRSGIEHNGDFLQDEVVMRGRRVIRPEQATGRLSISASGSISRTSPLKSTEPSLLSLCLVIVTRIEAPGRTNEPYLSARAWVNTQGNSAALSGSRNNRPAWVIASSIMTPGSTGKLGKWSCRYSSALLTCLRVMILVSVRSRTRSMRLKCMSKDRSRDRRACYCCPCQRYKIMRCACVTGIGPRPPRRYR